MLIVETSLSKTVDAIHAARFEGRAISTAERTRAARWLAGRQGLGQAYAETFGGFDSELKSGIIAFSGERFRSASARHILGEETSRALRWLGVTDVSAQTALTRADEGMMRCLERAATDPQHNPGMFCCGKCTVGLWRNLLSGGLDRQEERLRKGVARLRTMRSGDGEWRKFPFWYTVLALQETDVPEAAKELAYAAQRLERVATRATGATLSGQRRHEIARRALQRI